MSAGNEYLLDVIRTTLDRLRNEEFSGIGHIRAMLEDAIESAESGEVEGMTLEEAFQTHGANYIIAETEISRKTLWRYRKGLTEPSKSHKKLLATIGVTFDD